MIRQSIWFDNGQGFVMGENFKAPNPFVTRQDRKWDYCYTYFSPP